MSGSPLSLADRFAPDIPIEIIVKYHGSLRGLEPLGAIAEPLDENYAIITLPPAQIRTVAGFPEIEYIELPKLATASLLPAMRQSCIYPSAETPYNLTGRGVLIGIIDSGIDYAHPAFAGRILPGGDAADTIGHGTAVAGIAAAIAPEAALLPVRIGQSGGAQTTEIMRAVKYIIDTARQLGMPAAINLSFGTNNGAHDGASLFETYINEMAAKWKCAVVVASGNEGSSGHHAAGILREGETADIEFAVAPYLSAMYLALWKNFTDTVTIELISPGGESSGNVARRGHVTDMRAVGTSVGIIYGGPRPYSRNHEVYAVFSAKTGHIAEGIWKIRLGGAAIVDGRYDLWLPTVEEVSAKTAFSLPEVSTTLTLPGSAEKVITVGGYNSALNTAVDFSGRGNTRSGAVKPDLVAPAVSVLTARLGGGYDAHSGTSMAAPFVTGAAALMMQWGIVGGNDPYLYGERLKAYLLKGAKREQGISYPNPLWGYGTLCLKSTMDHIVKGE